MYAGPCLDWYVDAADDDVCILPLITANDSSVIAKEVTFEGEYLPPALELPLADFGLLEQDEHFRPAEEETPAPVPLVSASLPRLRNTTEVNLRDAKNQAPLKPFLSCSACAQRFQCKSQLARHQILWHEVEPLGLQCVPPRRNRCRLCREQFPSVKQLATHVTTQHPQCAVCNLCLTTFHDEATLEWHRKYHLHPVANADNQAARYACDVCQKRCASSSHLQLHRKVHLEQKPYSCGHCGRTFSSSGNRQKHIARVHTHERKYHCTKCDESFIYPRQLRLHRERKHAAGAGEDSPCEGRLTCPSCRRSFPSDGTLREHQQTEHYEEQRAFVCAHCGKRFKQATHLRNHLLTHTGVRAYGCEFCAKRFAMAGDLRVHRRIHTKEKPFRCDLCPAAFIMGKQLNKHRTTVHHGKTGKCEATT